MSSITDKIRKATRRVARDSIQRNRAPKESLPPKPFIYSSRDGKDVEVEVKYYYRLSDKENGAILASIGDSGKLKKTIEDIVAHKSSSSNSVSVILENSYGEKESVLVSTLDFKSITYDRDKKMLCCTTKREKTSQKVLNNGTQSLSKQAFKIDLFEKKDKDGESIIEKFSASTRAVEKQAVSTELSQSSPTEKIRGLGIEYPMSSDLFVESAGDKIVGYFFFNDARAGIYRVANEDIASLGKVTSKDVNLDLFVRRPGREQKSQRIEKLDKIDSPFSDSGLQLYRFEMPFRPGSFHFHMKYNTKDFTVDYSIQLLKSINSAVNILNKGAGIFSNPGAVKTIHKVYSEVREVLGLDSIDFNSFAKYVNEEKETSILGEIRSFLSSSAELVAKKYNLEYKEDGTITSANNSFIQSEHDFSKKYHFLHPSENKFQQRHTFEQVRKVQKEMKSGVVSYVPQKVTKDHRDDELDPSRSLDKMKQAESSINNNSRVTTEVYLLADFHFNKEHNVPLLKKPMWVKAMDESITSGEYFAKAIFRNKSGNIQEEYFMVTKE